MSNSPFGKRGGTSATAGRTASTYEAELPDGTTVRKRSFHVHQDEALLGCYKYEGRWYASGVTAQERTDWPGQIFVSARRVARSYKKTVSLRDC